MSPVLLAAAAGLVLLWRRGFRAEAGVCLVITLIFLFADMGYFEPYGGLSPGPRFFAPALPFLALGLVEAYKRQPLLTGILALWSITFSTLDALSWGNLNKLMLISAANTYWTPNTVWARLPILDINDSIYLVYGAAALTAAYAAVELVRAQAASSSSSRPSRSRRHNSV